MPLNSATYYDMKPLSFSSLRVRLLLLFALAVIPALGWIFYVHVEQRRLAATEAQDNALRLAQIAAAQQSQLIQEPSITERVGPTASDT